MRCGVIRIGAVGLLLVVLGSYVVAQNRGGSCAAEYDQWSKALNGLRDQLQAYRQAKRKSLEPRILEQLETISETGTTMARIVRSAISEHKQQLAEVAKEVQGVADEERTAFAKWRACMSNSRSTMSRSERASLRTAEKARRDALKELDEVH